jgi:phosphatidylserine/phosphatidylglycerophosphate/cardiolipin synthase-like enzyme
MSDRQVVSAASRAARRGARVLVLLDPEAAPNGAVAAELMRDGAGRIEIRWFAPSRGQRHNTLAMVRRRNEIWALVGGADFTRPSLDDFNLESAVELKLTARAAAGRILGEHFAREWSKASPYAQHADESPSAYWRYRVLEASGLAAF